MGIDKVTLRVGENRERVFASVRCTEKEEKTEIATCDLRPTKPNYYTNKVSLKRVVTCRVFCVSEQCKIFCIWPKIWIRIPVHGQDFFENYQRSKTCHVI